VYLERREKGWKVTAEPGPLGPLRTKRRAQLAARALDAVDCEDPADALPPLRAKLQRLSRDQRFEDAARMRDRLRALEEVVAHVAELERLREARLCILAPAREAGFQRAFLIAGGRVASARTMPVGGAGALELRAALAEAAPAMPSYAPADADELLAVAGFVRRPGPELRIVPLGVRADDLVAQSQEVTRILAA